MKLAVTGATGTIGRAVVRQLSERGDEVGTRVVLTRTGVVLARDGGALPKMLFPFKLGVGGPVAGGSQPFPWVHVEDAAAAMVFVLDAEAARGPVNVVAPEKHTNRT